MHILYKIDYKNELIQRIMQKLIGLDNFFHLDTLLYLIDNKVNTDLEMFQRSGQEGLAKQIVK